MLKKSAKPDSSYGTGLQMDQSSKSNSEKDLLNRVKSGDKEAYAEIYHAYYSELCLFLERDLQNVPVCENLIQDLFLNIWLKRKSWEPKSTIKAYLYRAARNRAVDYLRHKKLERSYIDQFKQENTIDREFYNADSQFQDTHLEPTDHSHLVSEVYKVVETMPEKMKLIFTLSRDDGLSYQEIADVLDISVKTVEVQMGRALKKLRKKMSGFFEKNRNI